MARSFRGICLTGTGMKLHGQHHEHHGRLGLKASAPHTASPKPRPPWPTRKPHPPTPPGFHLQTKVRNEQSHSACTCSPSHSCIYVSSRLFSFRPRNDRPLPFVCLVNPRIRGPIITLTSSRGPKSCLFSDLLYEHRKVISLCLSLNHLRT